MNSRMRSEWFIADIEPSIALAKAESFERYRTLPAQPEPPAVNAMTKTRTARDIMRRFAGFLLAPLFPRIRRATAEARLDR